MPLTITKNEEYGPNYLIVYPSTASYRVVIRRVRKEELMVSTTLDHGTCHRHPALSGLTWADVQLGPTALERSF